MHKSATLLSVFLVVLPNACLLRHNTTPSRFRDEMPSMVVEVFGGLHCHRNPTQARFGRIFVDLGRNGCPEDSEAENGAMLESSTSAV